MAELKEVYAKLAEAFDPSEVELKVQSRTKDGSHGLVVAYVEARTVMDRLDQVVGPDGWHDEYEVLPDKTVDGARLVEVRCRLTVLGVTKEDVGEGDTMKAAFSDALKRAAVKFGIGRYLYRLPKVYAELDDRGNIKDYNAVKARMLGGNGSSNGSSANESSNDLITDKQKWTIWKLVQGLDPDVAKKPKEEQNRAVREFCEAALGREVDPSRLTKAEASRVIAYLQELKSSGL